MTRLIILFSIFTFIVACGGGSGSVATGSNTGSSSTPAGVSGLSGSISDIEIIDVD